MRTNEQICPARKSEELTLDFTGSDVDPIIKFKFFLMAPEVSETIHLIIIGPSGPDVIQPMLTINL